MENNEDRSYARRSIKYKDHSNVGQEPDKDIAGDIEPADTRQARRQRDSKIPEMNPEDDLSQYDEFGRKRTKKKNSSAHRAKARNKRREVMGWILSIALAVAAALLIRAFIFEIIVVDGESMYPTLYTDERVAVEKVTRYGGMPNRGDIIIVEYPNLPGTFVKRTIGLPGDTIEVRNSVVYINGEPQNEDYINTEAYSDMPLTVVPNDHVFVMGDNRAHSLDSRTEKIGPIPHNAIIGHGMFVIWPLDNIHWIA